MLLKRVSTYIICAQCFLYINPRVVDHHSKNINATAR